MRAEEKENKKRKLEGEQTPPEGKVTFCFREDVRSPAQGLVHLTIVCMTLAKPFGRLHESRTKPVFVQGINAILWRSFLEDEEGEEARLVSKHLTFGESSFFLLFDTVQV